MKVLVGVCSHELQHVGAIRSAYKLELRDGDIFADKWDGRGDVARENFVDMLLSDPQYSPEDGVLLLDGDQKHHKLMLEGMRISMETNNLDMVCAHYYKRDTKLVQSLVFELGDGTYPFMPYLIPPKTGLHEVAWAGFGSVLIKKKVLQAVAATYPAGASPIGIGPLPELVGDSDNIGPDLRFFWKARQLGYKLWLDADVPESLHGVVMWMGHDMAGKLMDHTKWADTAQVGILEQRLELHGVTSQAYKQRLRILEARKMGLVAELQNAKEIAPDNTQLLYDMTVALHQMDGKIMEMQAWIEMTGNYPEIQVPADLPTTQNTPAQDMSPHGTTLDDRQESYRSNAVEMLQELPDVSPNGKN